MKRPINSVKLEDFGIQPNVSPNALDTIDRIIQYCRELGFIDGDVTDIERLIRDNDELELVYRDLGHLDAAIEKVQENKYIISINSKHPVRRQRFSMAHEYAHYQLHRNHLESLASGEQILHRSADRDPREYQANRLAGEILMPADRFVESMIDLNLSASALAERFEVSLQATRMRAKEVGRLLNE